MRDEYLKYINDTLQKHDNEAAETFSEMKKPPVFILAMPRSASTLFVQLCINMLDIGYISNFLARFYKAPVAGALLEQEILNPDFRSGYQSEYGNTKGALEPHEWGWFWREMLGLGKDEYYTTEDRVSKSLLPTMKALTSIKDKPVLIDNVFALSNMGIVKNIMPSALGVRIHRDTFYVCNSIINARIKRYGDVNAFYDRTPKKADFIMSADGPVEQVVRQVISIEEEMKEAESVYSEGQLFHVNYRDMCSDPGKVADDFMSFLTENKVDVTRKDFTQEPLICRDDPSLVSGDYRDELIQCLKRYGIEV